MLTIRTEQKEILARAAFETWLVNHVERCFVEECEALGPAATRALVRESVERGRRRGLTKGPALCRYVDLAFTFGRDFEKEPWAAELIAEAGGALNDYTMDALIEAGLAALDPEPDDPEPDGPAPGGDDGGEIR